MLRRKTAAVKEAGLGEEEQAEQLLTEMTKNKIKIKIKQPWPFTGDLNSVHLLVECCWWIRMFWETRFSGTWNPIYTSTTRYDCIPLIKLIVLNIGDKTLKKLLLRVLLYVWRCLRKVETYENSFLPLVETEIKITATFSVPPTIKTKVSDLQITQFI